jgi:hypothetical protein
MLLEIPYFPFLFPVLSETAIMEPKFPTGRGNIPESPMRCFESKSDQLSQAPQPHIFPARSPRFSLQLFRCDSLHRFSLALDVEGNKNGREKIDGAESTERFPGARYNLETIFKNKNNFGDKNGNPFHPSSLLPLFRNDASRCYLFRPRNSLFARSTYSLWTRFLFHSRNHLAHRNFSNALLIPS